MTIRVTAPILLPNTPDCDYPYGEELLTTEKIQQLVTSYKEYNLLDYEHQITMPGQLYFMKTVGTPVRVFTTDHDTSFTDISGKQITVPQGTAWLTSDIDDPYVESRIARKETVAYSVTVAEREDANEFMQLYKQSLHSNGAQKSMLSEKATQLLERISTKRVLISDIQDPVMLTVSVVAFPCVNKAMFCDRLEIEEEKNVGANKMAEEEFTEETLFSNLRKDISKLLGAKSETEESTTNDELQSLKDEISAMKTSNMELQDSVQDIVAQWNAQKNTAEEELELEAEEAGDSPVVEAEETETEDGEDDEVVVETESANKEEPVEEVQEVTSDTIPNSAEKAEEDETNPDSEPEETVDASTEEEVDAPAEEIVEKAEEPKTEEEVEPVTESKKHVARKGFRKKQIKTKSAQPQVYNPLNNEGVPKMKVRERDIIKNAVKGDGKSYKGITSEDVEYQINGYHLHPYYKHESNLKLLNNAGKHVFAESFSEDETDKAILSTEMFSKYVRELTLGESIFDFMDYETVYGEELIIRRIKSQKSYTSQDGHLPANYYFDVDPDADEMLTLKDVLRPVTQRDKISLSDRQLRNNVHGNDLLDATLDERTQTFWNGVYAARILGKTALDGQTYTDADNQTQNVEKQFTRRDGLVAQAGVKLEEGTDFGLDNILELFDTMFYSLPEAAQAQEDYAFFVPTGVRRAYFNHFLSESKENKRDYASHDWNPTFMDIPIYTSKTLNNPEFRNMLCGGDAQVLLMNKSNSKLGVGRGLGIEPERRADISATYYYLTLDTDAKFVNPDYAVVASIGEDEYNALTRMSVAGDVTGDSGNTGTQP